MKHQGYTYIHLANAMGLYLGQLRVEHNQAVKEARENPCRKTLERSKVSGDSLQELDDLLRIERQHVQRDMGFTIAMEFVGRVIRAADEISEESDRERRVIR